MTPADARATEAMCWAEWGRRRLDALRHARDTARSDAVREELGHVVAEAEHLVARTAERASRLRAEADAATHLTPPNRSAA